MGIYGVRPEELLEPFEEFLREQEGQVSAYTIVKVWNTLADKYNWKDKIKEIK